jgi:uncharacterized protein (TIGR02147 family)
MKPIFQYLDYREVLKDAFEDRREAVPDYPCREMAEFMELDTGYMYRILQKQRHLPVRCQPRALEYMGLSGRGAEYFLHLAAHARERRPRAKQELLEKALALRDVAIQAIAENEVALFRDWWVVATRCLLEVLDGRSNPVEIASRLSPPISAPEASKALEILLELGLIRKAPSGRFALAEVHLSAGGERMTPALLHFQKQVFDLARESLERFPKNLRNVTTLTIAADEKSFQAVNALLKEFRRQVQKVVEGRKTPDRVMQLAMAFFPVAAPAQVRP